MENKDIFKLKGSKKIIVVTNRHLVKENFLKAIEKCVLYGADAVMLREKDLQYEELMEVGEQIKNITDNYGVPLIINGNFRAALELETYGFHTGFEKFKSMNRSEKNSLCIGVSVHSSREAVEAEKLGADYVMAGNVFETSCKIGLKGRGINFIDDIANKIFIPVIAIGGIGRENIESVLGTKASGAAIMSYAMNL
ncbi:thiamine phosphate synthase [Clostridium tyrobutyricum]|jgi:thiamine-phosphate pyrophosphorylase|uniref:thiamine phosphate synthase n=1 Tax=Clostridium tyrobutyricum TaxID=1519 RepID=UPI0010A9B988|nr:thiamine phosphate synthase [Clostridium tyrobutyricum]QCH29144.1 Regulatory protein TenI [Clostridium tyrobutyricum]